MKPLTAKLQFMVSCAVMIAVVLSIMFVYLSPSTSWSASIRDHDGDGVADAKDAFPNDRTETVDTDHDGVGDNKDRFPNDYTEANDTDFDGVGDNEDAFPNDGSEWSDADRDGVGDKRDRFPSDYAEWNDSDSDGVGDNRDAFPNDSKEWNDTDLDGVGDNTDACPNDPTETLDTDHDGVGDNSDLFPDDPWAWGYGNATILITTTSNAPTLLNYQLSYNSELVKTGTIPGGGLVLDTLTPTWIDGPTDQVVLLSVMGYWLDNGTPIVYTTAQASLTIVPGGSYQVVLSLNR